MKRKEDLPEKESKLLSKRPEKLGKIIDLVNRVPFDLVLVDGEATYKKHAQAYLSNIDQALSSKEDVFLEVLNKTLEECFANVPEDFRKYIEEKGWQHARHYQDRAEYQLILLRRTLSEYIEFYDLREDLKDFVNYFANWRKSGFVSIGSGGQAGLDGRPLRLPTAQATLVKNIGGKAGTLITVEPYGLSAALDGIVGERVRSCEICNNIFWAQRKESETCSTHCANIFRVRRHREKTEDKTSKA